jgi:AcrR family transcriptional regulator
MKAKAPRTSRGDWLLAGLLLLRDGGGEALTIERLCRSLGRTKGSFYHHFGDISAYHEALLEHWATLHTELPMAEAASAIDGEERRQLLYRALRRIDIGVELAVHAWAIRSPVARAAADRVHARRIAYLAVLRPGQRDAVAMAELEYASFLGALHLYPAHRKRRQRVIGFTRMVLG